MPIDIYGAGSGGGGADELVKVSSNDTTSGYLNGKLVAGTGITLTENTDGGNETFTIAASGGAGSGDVVGPASSTDNAVARFDSTTGKLIQNSGVVIDDSDNITCRRYRYYTYRKH